MITAFLPYSGAQFSQETVDFLINSKIVTKIYLLVTDENITSLKNCEILVIDNLFSSKTINLIREKSNNGSIILFTEDNKYEFGQFAIERFFKVSSNTGAGLVYSDYNVIKNDEFKKYPLIDYQLGSLRDDFNFGPIVFINSELLNTYKNEKEYSFAGIYDLRLHISRNSQILRIPECLYTTIESDNRKSGIKQFDYVNPKNREVQIEMELSVTDHLKK